MIIFQILMCILILIAAPLCMGMAVVSGLKVRSLFFALSFGYLVMMVSFEIVTVQILLLTEYANFHYVLFIYTPIMLAISVFGVIRALKTGFLKESVQKLNNSFAGIVSSKEKLVVWGLAGALLIVILVLTLTRVIFDGDDAYYVVQSLIAQQKGTMYSSNPYTGRAAAIDMRHALAVFPMWIAYVATVTNIHATALCHSVLPIVFIPLTLIVYGQTGALLLKDKNKDKEKKELTGYFVLFIELFILFGRVSLYTPEAFLMARTWQGKSVAANVLLPMTFLVLWVVYSYESAEDADPALIRRAWVLVAIINASAGIFSSLAVVLTCVIICSGGALMSFLKWRSGARDRGSEPARFAWRPFLYSCICCIPGILYMLLYLYYTYFGWRS